MDFKLAQPVMAKYLAIAAALTTVILTFNGSDPVNLPKMVVLVTAAFGLFAILLVSSSGKVWNEQRVLLFLLILFLMTAIWAVVNSGSPFNQNFYGSFGRNTGLLTYLALAMICLVAAAISSYDSVKLLLWSLLFAGFVNIIYCLWVIVFGDFFPWDNQYGNILGTLGNPNFIGAFLGIFVTVLFAYLIDPKTQTKFRIIGAFVIIIALIEIRSSHAVQGVVVSAGGTSLVFFFFLRSRFKRNLIPIIYVIFVTSFGTIAVLGALQKGPLAEIIYKTSVSLRGEYWQAAWNMAQLNPFTGVGMDSYGDWYRRARDSQALILPGSNVTTNAAHNVPFDLLAYGGWPLFSVFLAIILISMIAIVKIVFRSREYNWVTTALVSAWACYQVQSIISINQIGLAIWGWIFIGAVIGYERFTRKTATTDVSLTTKTSFSRKSTVNVISPQLVFGVCSLVGLFVVLPPYSADIKFTSALKSGQLTTIYDALSPSYLNPLNPNVIMNAAQVFINSNLNNDAYKYAKIGVELNPESHDLWRLLYFTSTESLEEKALAKSKLIELDPLNQEWKNLP
jgi:O-antigen ligase